MTDKELLAAVERGLTQIGDAWTDGGRRYARYRCGCGEVVVRRTSNVSSRRTRSCGCLDRERRTTHGGSSSQTYKSWTSMLYRCESPSHPKYHNYGGRGISVCERWKTFEAFWSDMGDRPAGTTLDRKDSDGNYEPGNCRWATPKQQRRNSRQWLLMLTIDDRTMTAIDWSMEPGAAKYDCILSRKKRGWDDRDAVFAPQQRGGRPSVYARKKHEVR